MTRRAPFLFATLLACVSCSGGATEPKTVGHAAQTPLPPPESAPDPEAGIPPERRKGGAHLARMLGLVSELRQLPSKKPVPGEWLTRRELVGRVKEKALREFPSDVLRREGLVLQLMDFAPPGFDYLSATLQLLEAQLEGFYEPKDGTMYIASDLHGEEAEATLAHELVHALQDQHWDLRSRSDYKPGRSDETLALAALAEGDATSVMLDFILAEKEQTAIDLPDHMMRGLMTSSMQLGNVQSVPHILRASLVSPYVEGLAFVNTLRRRGKWKGVDGAWESLPKTTEQILHPDKWEKREKALVVPAPTVNALGAGWKIDDEDTAGELGYALMFGEWMSEQEARLAASGWGGDRSIVVTKGEEIAGIDLLRYDEGTLTPSALAERGFTKVSKGLAKKYGKPAIESATFSCFERPTTGPISVLRRGRDLVVTAGPAKVTGTTWTSTGTCALARTWAEEAAQPRAQTSLTSESPTYAASVWMR